MALRVGACAATLTRGDSRLLAYAFRMLRSAAAEFSLDLICFGDGANGA